MKIFDLSDIIRIGKEQGFVHACLVDRNEVKIVPFNKNTVSLDMQFKKIKKRFESDLCQDGEYFVLMSESLRNTNSPNRFSIYKGDPQKKEVQIITTPSQDVLSWNSALQMMQEISELKATNLFLTQQVESLKKDLAELEAEIEASEAIEAESGGGLLGEAKKATSGFLNDNGPMLIQLIDKHFSLKEREISLKEKQASAPAPVQSTGSKRNMQVGSEAHLAIIKRLHSEANETELNKHLDLLEAKNKPLHDKLCSELGITLNDPKDE